MEEKRCISLLGSTGSIGRQALEVMEAGGMAAAALTANRDVGRLEEQCRRFQPELAVMMDPAAAADLRVRLADTPVRVAAGMEGLLEAAALPDNFVDVGGHSMNTDYDYTMSVAADTITLTADHGKSLTFVAVNIARV